jgi:hypothetical protein
MPRLRMNNHSRERDIEVEVRAWMARPSRTESSGLEESRSWLSSVTRRVGKLVVQSPVRLAAPDPRERCHAGLSMRKNAYSPPLVRCMYDSP